MNQYEKLEQLDYDFVKETFSADWPITEIAKKLERPVSTIYAIVKYLGLKRPSYDVKTPSHDWPSIWYAYCACGSYAAAADALGISRQVVAYAVHKMIMMGTEKRLIRWNKYALKHDREPYTWADANGMI